MNLNDNKIEKSAGNRDKKNTYRLFDISVDEISLVDKAAVNADGMPEGKNFILFKRMTDELNNPTLTEDPILPDLTNVEKDLLEQFDDMSEEQQLETVDQLSWLFTRWQIQKLEEALDDLKKRDSFMWAAVDSRPEDFDIDETTEPWEITRKADAPKPKPVKEWDERNGRWVQKLGKPDKLYND